MNKVILVGRLTKDPELKTTQSGLAVARFTIAISQNFTNRNGERGTDFINCVVWEKQASNIAKYCHKGSLVSAEGRLTNRSYDAPDGTKRYETYVVVERVQFLSSKSESTPSMPDPEYALYKSQEPKENEPDKFEEFSKEADLSGLNEVTLNPDDLPF